MNADWFYSVGDTRQGPVTEDDLKRLAADGQLRPSDLVWRDGMPDWVEARSVDSLFPKAEARRRPADNAGGDAVRRRLDSAFEEDDRPSRRGRPRDEDDEDDRPSRRSRRRDDEDDEDYDRPRARRGYDDDYRDDYEDRPRRRRQEKPGQIQAVGIMMLVGGILAILVFLSWAASCIGLLWPGIYFELVVGILAIIRGVNMINQDDQGPPKTLAILQIVCILNLDVINCVLGIVSLVMLSDEGVQRYYRKKGFY